MSGLNSMYILFSSAQNSGGFQIVQRADLRSSTKVQSQGVFRGLFSGLTEHADPKRETRDNMKCYCCKQPSTYFVAEFNRRSIGLGGGGGTRFFCRGCAEMTEDKKDDLIWRIQTEDKGFRLIANCSNKGRKDEDVRLEVNWAYRCGGNNCNYV